MLPNEQEALLLSGQNSLTDAIADLRKQVPLLAIKMGEAGAKVYNDDGVIECPVQPAAPGGDGIGAGDSFDASFVAGWLNGLSLQDCLDIACQCRRGVAGKIGGTRGQPNQNDIRQLQFRGE